MHSIAHPHPEIFLLGWPIVRFRSLIEFHYLIDLSSVSHWSIVIFFGFIDTTIVMVNILRVVLMELLFFLNSNQLSLLFREDGVRTLTPVCDRGHILLFYTIGGMPFILGAITGSCTCTHTPSETVICHHSLYSFPWIVNGSLGKAPISCFLTGQILHERAFVNRWSTLRCYHWLIVLFSG